MAKLVKCKDCGHEISKKAKKCPQCGAPQKKKTSGCAWIALVVLGLLLFVFIKGMVDAPPRSSSPSRQSPPVESSKPSAAPQPSMDLAPIRAVASHQRADGKTVLQRYQEVSQIADTNYGWYGVPCPSSLCHDQAGHIVSFRIDTSVGPVTPLWFVDKDLNVSWINGKASGMSPDLPQASGIDIGSALDLIKNQPAKGLTDIK